MKEKLTQEEWYEKIINDSTLYGLSWSKIKELIDLFREAGYNIISAKDFKAMKLKYFGKVN